MMQTVGIIAAKQHSRRFENKNISVLNKDPLFWHSVAPLLASNRVQRVVVATDSPIILRYCRDRGVEVVWRGENASASDEPLLDVLKFVYKVLGHPFEIVACIMANCPGHTGAEVDAAVGLLESKGLREVRGFRADGTESGLLVFDSSVLTEQLQISSHLGCVMASGSEIHYASELAELAARDPAVRTGE